MRNCLSLCRFCFIFFVVCVCVCVFFLFWFFLIVSSFAEYPGQGYPQGYPQQQGYPPQQHRNQKEEIFFSFFFTLFLFLAPQYPPQQPGFVCRDFVCLFLLSLIHWQDIVRRKNRFFLFGFFGFLISSSHSSSTRQILFFAFVFPPHSRSVFFL